jgi:hypothetical protein
MWVRDQCLKEGQRGDRMTRAYSRSIGPRTAKWAMLLMMSIIGIGFVPLEGRAMLAPPDDSMVSPSKSGFDRAQDLQTVQAVLEHKVIRQKLLELGLTDEEINGRLNRLSDAQLHQAAMQINSLSPGGSIDGALGTILTVLLIILVVVVILILI